MVTDDVFAVIAESTRRDILVALRAGDKAVGELVEELAASQPTISKHLKVLREAQLVSMRAQGQKRYYALNRAPLEGIATWLETFDVGPGTDTAPSPAAQSPAAQSPAATGQEAPARLKESAAAGNLQPAAQGLASTTQGPTSTTQDLASTTQDLAPAADPASTRDVTPDRDVQLAEPAPAKAEKAANEEKPAPVLAREGAGLSPAVVIPGGTNAPLSDDSVPQQIGRTVGRAATKAADLLASLPNLPKFGRKK
ncbi:MAG: ArsR/SmtB family transcription factor [Actinomycetes bacterium]